MTTVVMIRHARSQANAEGILAGRSDSPLDEIGIAQAEELGRRLVDVDLDALFVSPQLRAQLTARAAAGGRLEPTSDDAFAECDYGDWSGRSLAELAKEPLWSIVQRHPSRAAFPGGESLVQMAQRAVARVRGLVAERPDEIVWVVSHGDVIKAMLADALGMHLDGFQRLVVDPASISVVRYSDHAVLVDRINTTAGFSLRRNSGPSGTEAVVGGRDTQ